MSRDRRSQPTRHVPHHAENDPGGADGKGEEQPGNARVVRDVDGAENDGRHRYRNGWSIPFDELPLQQPTEEELLDKRGADTAENDQNRPAPCTCVRDGVETLVGVARRFQLVDEWDKDEPGHT